MEDPAVKDTDTSLATLLRQERGERGYSLATLSRLSGIPKSVLGSWEAGTRRPSGANLEAVLQTLKVEEGLRSLLLYQADRVHASKALADNKLKTPTGQAELLRGVRYRSGMSQAQVAQVNGTTQSAVAKWESGDRVLDSEALLRVFASMGANPEEILAASQFEAIEDNPIRTPSDAWKRLEDIRLKTPLALKDLLSIVLEAQIWRKATLDPRFTAPLVSCLDYRTQILYVQRRINECDALTKRTLEIASAEGLYDQAFYAAYCLVGSAILRRNSPSKKNYRHYEEWGERCCDRNAKFDVQMGLAMARQDIGSSHVFGQSFLNELFSIAELPVGSKIGFHKEIDRPAALLEYVTEVVHVQNYDEALIAVEDHFESVLGLPPASFSENPELLRERPRTKLILFNYVEAMAAFKEPVPRRLWEEIKDLRPPFASFEVKSLSERIMRIEKRIRLSD